MSDNLKGLPEAATILRPGDVLLVKVGANVAVEDLHGLRDTLAGSANKVIVFADDVELLVIPAASGVVS